MFHWEKGRVIGYINTMTQTAVTQCSTLMMIYKNTINITYDF